MNINQNCWNEIKIIEKLRCVHTKYLFSGAYNSHLVYCRELAPGTVSLTGDRAQADDSKHDSHYTFLDYQNKY